MKKALFLASLIAFTLSVNASPPLEKQSGINEKVFVNSQPEVFAGIELSYDAQYVFAVSEIEIVEVDIAKSDLPSAPASTEIILPKATKELPDYGRQRKRSYIEGEERGFIYTGYEVPGFGPLYLYGSLKSNLDLLPGIGLFRE